MLILTAMGNMVSAMGDTDFQILLTLSDKIVSGKLTYPLNVKQMLSETLCQIKLESQQN